MHDSGSHDHLEDVIDDVARSMTEGLPTRSIRNAVRTRVEQRPRGRRWALGVATWRVSLAAAAVVLAFVVGQNLSGPPEPVAPSGDGATSATPGAVRAESPAAAVVSPPTTADATPVPRRNATGADARSGAGPAIAALAAPRLLVIESLE